MNKEEIREKRSILNLSQEQMARRVGVSVATVQRWEKGQHTPSQLAESKLKRLFKREEHG